MLFVDRTVRRGMNGPLGHHPVGGSAAVVNPPPHPPTSHIQDFQADNAPFSSSRVGNSQANIVTNHIANMKQNMNWTPRYKKQWLTTLHAVREWWMEGRLTICWINVVLGTREASRGETSEGGAVEGVEPTPWGHGVWRPYGETMEESTLL